MFSLHESSLPRADNKTVQRWRSIMSFVFAFSRRDCSASTRVDQIIHICSTLLIWRSAQQMFWPASAKSVCACLLLGLKMRTTKPRRRWILMIESVGNPGGGGLRPSLECFELLCVFLSCLNLSQRKAQWYQSNTIDNRRLLFGKVESCVRIKRMNEFFPRDAW